MNSQTLQSYMLPGGGYGYTAAPVEGLASFENTLALGLLDESGSTDAFARQMELCVKEIIKSLRSSPRADNLIYRHCHFASRFREHHGFTPLGQINEANYDGCYQPGGQTTLYDSCDRAIRELVDYAQKQAAQKYTCNGFLYFLTDGCDYGSTLNESDIKKALVFANGSETLESLITILIGINPVDAIQDGLKTFAANVGFTQYVPIEKADANTLKKLAKFVSQSIAAQSQALGTGGPSQSLTF